jgi:adenylate cyclase
VARNGDGKEILFSISGVLNKTNGTVETIWQTVDLGKNLGNLSEGSVFENVHIQNIVRPYIPGLVLQKAREALRSGRFLVPNEQREVTIFFLDLIGFTAISETLPPGQVIDLLNLAMGVAVKSIEGNGGAIDKFIGDGIMAIFSEPLPAVVAAFEIQNNFSELNLYRRVSGKQPVEMRIGINTGRVILGSIGTKDRMDFTALGDVVNTASRIEKSSEANSVLVSDATYEKIRNHVTVHRSLRQKVKGKQNEITLHFLKSVSFNRAGKNLRMDI